MVHVTLVGDRLARVGSVFVFKGPLLECRECKYKQVCFNLAKGRSYKVVRTRPARHDCNIHEGGVTAVEVEVISFDAGIRSRIAVEGSIIPLDDKGCRRIGCEHYHICHPIGKTLGGKFKIKRLIGTIDCPQGDRISKVVLEE